MKGSVFSQIPAAAFYSKTLVKLQPHICSSLTFLQLHVKCWLLDHKVLIMTDQFPEKSCVKAKRNANFKLMQSYKTIKPLDLPSVKTFQKTSLS